MLVYTLTVTFPEDIAVDKEASGVVDDQAMFMV